MTSAGQVVLDPVQVSAGSHPPAEARQTAPALPTACGQVAPVPSHRSRVQGFASAVQAVPLVFLASVGQLVLDPVQLSARSHSPAAARQTVPALPAGWVQVALVPLQMSMVHTLPSSVH